MPLKGKTTEVFHSDYLQYGTTPGKLKASIVMLFCFVLFLTNEAVPYLSRLHADFRPLFFYFGDGVYIKF